MSAERGAKTTAPFSGSTLQQDSREGEGSLEHKAKAALEGEGSLKETVGPEETGASHEETEAPEEKGCSPREKAILAATRTKWECCRESNASAILSLLNTITDSPLNVTARSQSVDQSVTQSNTHTKKRQIKKGRSLEDHSSMILAAQWSRLDPKLDSMHGGVCKT